MFELREMSPDELPRLTEIDVSERGTVVYYYTGGRLTATPEAWYRPQWNAETWRDDSWATVLGVAGVRILGAFESDRLIGVAVLRPHLTPSMAQLAALFVSREHRRRGVAAALVTALCQVAQAQGHQAMYVSATPSESAVGFYQRQGFQPTDQVHPELFALEPEDIHLVKPL